MSRLFKASQPQYQTSLVSSEEVEPSPKGLAWVRNDPAEIGGSLKSGLSKLSSSLFPFRNNRFVEEDEEEEEAEYVTGIHDRFR